MVLTSPAAPRLAALAAVALAASLLPPVAARADTPAIPWGNVACDPPPEGIPEPGSGQQCAYVAVPLDHGNPAGRQILLAVSIVRADPAQRRGVLFLNAGGPGGPGLDLPRYMHYLLGNTLGQEAATALLSRYDLIGFDPRFVGHSTGASCGLTEQQADQALVPITQDHSFEATARFVRRVAGGCEKHIGADTMPFATTAHTARDMDLIRQRLGEDKLNYFAWSYGTYLGAVYATLFPDRTDRVILDSAVGPDWVWRTQFRQFGPGGAQRWPDFAQWAAANDATYRFGRTPQQVTQLYYRLYARADADPRPYPPALPSGALVNGPMFRELNFFYLAHDVYFPLIAELWQSIIAAREGSRTEDAEGPDAEGSLPAAPTAPAGMATAAMPRPPQSGPSPPIPAALLPIPVDNKAASALAILCGDVTWPRSEGQYRHEFHADSRSYPMFGPLGSNIWPCAYWPNPIEPPVQISSNGPGNILILQNLRDPNTPYAGGLGMHAALGPRSRLVTLDGGGHAIFGYETNACVNRMAVAYLQDGVRPGQDVFCPAEPPPATRAHGSPEQRRRLEALERRFIRGWLNRR
jgi:pimeloyl-ACP methyl ester carboxylesterase